METASSSVVAQPRTVPPDVYYRDIHLTPRQWIVALVVGTPLFVVRVPLVGLSIVLVFILGLISTAGLDPDKPPTEAARWRKFFRRLSTSVGRMGCRIAGFSVTVVGEQATAEAAPILCAAPHTSFFDVVVGFYLREIPYCVSRVENRSIPFVRKILDIFNTVYVDRKDGNSKEMVLEKIRQRSMSGSGWQQLIIFPQGMCSYPEVLTLFSRGAFVSGRPVQPLLIRYLNRDGPDTTTWPWAGNYGWMTTFWLTLARPLTRLRIEFMDVHTPSTAEMDNEAELFRTNVRAAMGAALGSELVEVNYYDLKSRQRRHETPIDRELLIDGRAYTMVGEKVETQEGGAKVEKTTLVVKMKKK